jgi:hypothetical protein
VVIRTALTSGSASTEDLSPPDEVDINFVIVSPVCAGETLNRTAAGGGAAGQPGQHVCHHIVRACYVLDITRELCSTVHGSVDRRMVVVRGLWSVNSVNCLPSSMKRKWRMAWKQASNYLSKAEYLTWVLSSFLEKKPGSCHGSASRRRCCRAPPM